MYQAIGWIGSILFAFCGVPLAWDTWKRGHSDGNNWTFLLMWFFGEVLTIIYVLPTFNWPLLFNYAVNMICLLVVLKYKWKPRV